MKKINYPILILSLFLSISINLKIIIDNSLDKFIKSFHINFFFISKVVILCVIFYFLFYYLFKLIDKIPLSKNKLTLNKKNIVFIFLVIFVPTMIYLLSHYPGVYLNDTMFMLYYPVSKMNPVIYGMFISIGMSAQTKLVEDLLQLSDSKYVSSEDCETNKNNIFVAGDCRDKSIRQLTTAVADGTTAAIKAIKYLEGK